MFTWERKLTNALVTVFCDNQSVVEMVNLGVSSCKNYMYLLHLLVLNRLEHNRCVFARHVVSSKDILADSLLRLKIAKFKALDPPGTKLDPEITSPKIWPMSHLWQK